MTPQHKVCPVCELPALVEPQFHNVHLDSVECPRCGRFEADPRSRWYFEETPRHIVSGAIRDSFERGIQVKLSSPEDVVTLAASPWIPHDPRAKLDRILTYMSDRQKRLDVFQDFHPETDYPIAFAVDPSEFGYMLGLLIKRGQMERPPDARGEGYRLTLDGWSTAIEIADRSVRPDQAFVAMWFDSSMKDARDVGLIPALEATGFVPLVMNMDEHNDRIDDRITVQIRKSGLLVAEMTGQRQGVYFEAGLAMGLGIPVIWVCHEDDLSNAHFDTRQFNHVVWDTPEELRERLENRIRATIPDTLRAS